MKRRLLAMALVLAVGVGTLTGCGVPKEDKKASESGNVLRYATRQDPPTLDPQLMNSIPSATIGYHIFDGLMRSQKGEIIPAAAESYEMSEDGMTYTFQLRDGLKWSDGEALKAEDFVYGFQRLLDPATASEYAFLGMVVKNAAKVNAGEVGVEELGIKAIDEKTVEIQLEYAAPYFLGMLSNPSFMPTRKDQVDEFGKEFAGDAEKNVYNGPFMVKNWKHNDRLILEKNPNYWDADNIKLDGAEILTVADANTAVAMYESDELDFTDIPQTMSEKYKEESVAFFDGANDYVTLNENGQSPYLVNKNIRLALNYAMNREDYIKLLGGVYAPNTRYVLPDVKGVEKTYGEEHPYEAYPVAGDLDKAKTYLATGMSELGIANASDITLELLIADAESVKKQAEIIQAQLEKALGIKIDIKQVPYKQRLQQEADHDFQMVISGWVPDYSDALSYLEIWTTDSPYNRASYNSEAYDKLVKESNLQTDPKLRQEALFNAEKVFCEDGVVIPLQLRQMEMLVNDRVKGLETSFVGYQYDFMNVEMK
ncbi:MAG: peptide ABC transporter substrate-binding protein [Lachnospiraceae bacterium]